LIELLVVIAIIAILATLPALTWFGSTGVTSQKFPFANHLNRAGVPGGGNFLYEDGSVLWRKFDLGTYKTTIDIGSAASGWVVFYHPADLDPGPW